MKSAILTGNAFYQSHLHQFLTPVVGSHPQWLLCYRASSHGWRISTFHSRCDGKRNTVTIIKTGQYVFGGYTDIPWGKKEILFYISYFILARYIFAAAVSHETSFQISILSLKITSQGKRLWTRIKTIDTSYGLRVACKYYVHQYY